MKTEVERTIEFAENMKREGRKEREAEIIEMMKNRIGKRGCCDWIINSIIKQIKEQRE